MSAANERGRRRARLPRAVCRCARWAVFDGSDRCLKCGKLWPSAYGERQDSRSGYALLLAAIERHDPRPRRRR